MRGGEPHAYHAAHRFPAEVHGVSTKVVDERARVGNTGFEGEFSGEIEAGGR